MKLQVTRVNNPLNRNDKDFLTIDEDGWDFLASELQKLPDESYYLYINGNRCLITHKVKDSDQIVIMPRVAGGDSTKQILGLVAMVALMYFGVPTIATMLQISQQANPFMYAVLAASVMVGGGMIINSLMPSPSADTDIARYKESYGWNPQNTQQQGLSIPRYYGKNKIYGNVIAVHTETDASDNTKEVLKALLCTGMGPVNGIVDDNILINDQKYTAFSDVSVEEKRGLISQTPISFFSETKAEYRVGILVEYGNSQTYLTPDADYDDLEIVVSFDRGLFYANDQGGLSNHTVGIKIEIREEGATLWDTLMSNNVTSNTTSVLYKKYRASNSYTGGSPVTINQGSKYEVRVTKTTADQTSSRYGDRVNLFAIREVLQDGFTYPRKALLGIEALATDQLSGGLTLSCVQEGLIINTYDDSSWTLEYSNNPAWVLWDILTQPVITGDGDSTPYSIVRYEGMNPSRLDLPKFYELAQFCDDLVSDGEDGTEKRITFNGGFETGTNMFEAALKVCGVARCVPIWQGMNLTLAIDKPSLTVGTFSDGNIIAGTFKETFLPIEDRISEVEVSHVDALKDFERTVFSVYDPESTNFYNKATLDLHGITKSSEAWRAGMLKLLHNRYTFSTVEFDADIEAIMCSIGDVIYVQSSIPDWGEGGRIISATSNTVTLDKEVDFGEGTKKILVKTYDPANEQEQIDEKIVDSIDGATVTITDTWTVTPSANDIYAIGPTTDISKKYRVVGLRKSSDQILTITALEYNEAVYNGDDSEPTVPLADYTEPGSIGTNIIKPPSVNSIKNIYPIETLFNESTLTADIPLFNGLGWTDDSPSTGSVTTSAFNIYYKGTTYQVAQFSSAYQFFYWTHDYNSGQELRSTDSLATVLANSGWIVGMNLSGIFSPRYGSPVIHGGIIQSDTIDTNHLKSNSVDATKMNISDLSAISANLGSIQVDTANIKNAAIGSAQIDTLAVNTSNIASNAVSNTVNASSASGVTVTSLTYQNLASLSITTAGGKVQVLAGMTMTASGGIASRMDILICRDSESNVVWYGAGLLINNGATEPFGMPVYDLPSSGSHTYYIKARKTASLGLGECTFTYRSLTLVELKK